MGGGGHVGGGWWRGEGGLVAKIGYTILTSPILEVLIHF